MMNNYNIKVLNLYAGIGGNRKLWKDVEVTAVEWDKKIAKIYQDLFPQDKMVITDAHPYLLEHFNEFDFIWSSPPCPTHSRIRNEAGVGRGQNEPCYPDMALYQEIIFLQHMFKMKDINFKGKYVVENVIGYYKPLIHPQIIHRHYFWANFIIPPINLESDNVNIGKRVDWEKQKELDLSGYDIPIRKDTFLRNYMNPELGLHILEASKSKALF